MNAGALFKLTYLLYNIWGWYTECIFLSHRAGAFFISTSCNVLAYDLPFVQLVLSSDVLSLLQVMEMSETKLQL